MEKQYYVQMKGVNKSFGSFQASKNINFGIEKGKLVGLLGPSGSGKTTILRMLAGLETADSGDILIDGNVVNDVPASKRGIGFVFQSYALFRYMTIYDNIAFGLKIQKWPKQRIKERVHEMLKLVGLEGLENRYPNQLSGGQRQRVAFARALAPQPQLLLLDEPFAAIDAKVRLELRSWLREMISSVGVTSIFVTHDQDEAIEVADQIIITNQGQIEQIGSPKDIYRTPQTPFVAKFIGQSSVVEDFQKFSGFENADVRAKHAAIRPEYITVTKQGEYLKYPIGSEEGVVESTAFRGSEIELKIRVKDSVLTAKRLLDEAPIEVGESVKVFIYRAYAFDNEQAYVIENAALTSPDSVFI